MIMTVPDLSRVFSPYEIVKLRRNLITSGEHIDCPRCLSSVRLARLSDDPGGFCDCTLHCSSCGLTATLAGIPEAALPH